MIYDRLVPNDPLVSVTEQHLDYYATKGNLITYNSTYIQNYFAIYRSMNMWAFALNNNKTTTHLLFIVTKQHTTLNKVTA